MNLRRLAGHGILAEYGRTTPGEQNSVTRGNAIGVAFTPQRHAVWSVGGAHHLSGAIEPSSVFIAPKEGVAWTAWDLIGETVEVWLDGDDLSRLSHEHGGPSRIEFGFHDRIDDRVIVDIAARIRWLICAPFPSAERLTELGRELAGHYLENYAGVKVTRRSIRPLDAARLGRVVTYIDAHLHEAIALDQLADAAAMSPFHFARTFKAATGAPPHAFVVRRRMDRAAALFRSTDLTVAEVAAAAGFASLPHFRAHFRNHWAADPGAFSRVAGF
jgi:AraC family transcriptional regulator